MFPAGEEMRRYTLKTLKTQVLAWFPDDNTHAQNAITQPLPSFCESLGSSPPRCWSAEQLAYYLHLGFDFAKLSQLLKSLPPCRREGNELVRVTPRIHADRSQAPRV